MRDEPVVRRGHHKEEVRTHLHTRTGIETGISISWRPQTAQSPASFRYVLILHRLFNFMSSVLVFEPIQYSFLKYACFLRIIPFKQSTNQ